MEPLTRERAEKLLVAYGTTTASRDELVRASVACGVSKHRVHVLTGIARTTIDAILAQSTEGTRS